MKRSVLAAAFGLSAIACVAGPFAVVGQRHAPAPVAPPPITHTTAIASPVPSVVKVETFSPPAPPVPHTFRVADLASDSRMSIGNGAVGKHGFLGAIVAAGLSPKEAHRVLVGFSGVRNLDRESGATTFTFAKAHQDGHVVAFELLPAGAMDGDALELFQEREKIEGERLAAARVSLAIERKRVKVGIVVQGNDALRASIASAELHEDAATALDDALDGHAELSDLRAGSRLRIVATEQRIEGAFVGYAPLDAVEYTPVGKPAIRVYWYGKGSSAETRHHAHGGYYDTTGRQPYRGGWRSPVPMARISSRFNPNRMHPILHVITPHNGVDFAATSGTPVYAASAGTIRSAGDGGPCGNMVQIDHGIENGAHLISAYCHLSKFANISAGEHVEARQLIGYVGQTGRATGPHLHFAVKRLNANGVEQFIDPMSMKLDGVRIVPPRLRGDFDELKRAMDAEIDSITLPEPVPATKEDPKQNEPEETE